ncbi:MAG TPA: hypothetical protein VMZ31_09170 [Phycisphaerae bacterium]|nr:hypothetical protein [Phycisphaerae bacterium]
MKRVMLLAWMVGWLILSPGMAEVVRLKATADVWLSDATAQERNSSAGKADRFKLKSIQEMAAIRFDAEPIAGRQVQAARLFLHRAGEDKLRYLRVSTVNQDWVEGEGTANYGPPDGATYLYADAASKKRWAWPGSCMADVIVGSGNSLTTWAERKELADGWISVALTPELVYALAVGDTDGLAVMEGGTVALTNNFVHSAQAKGFEPYIEVEVGGALTEQPGAPVVRAEPGIERADLQSGAVRVTIGPAGGVHCWRLWLDGESVDRWRVRHPAAHGETVFYLEGLAPAKSYELKVVAVSPGGQVSPPAVAKVKASPALSGALSLGPLHKPDGQAAKPLSAERMKVWAYPGLVKLDPQNGAVMYGDMEEAGAGGGANAVWDGQGVRLFGARGEYVSFQLCIEKIGDEPLSGIRVVPQTLQGPDGATIGGTEIELFKNWYAQNRDKKWQPAYCVPIAHGTPLAIPDADRKLEGQKHQSVYVDIYIPKDAKPGSYAGSLAVEGGRSQAVAVPVSLRVFDFVLPDRLSFWPELNAYSVPGDAHDYYRLAHQHRCVLNCWRWVPEVSGSGKDIKVIWDEYDRGAGPLLTGKAFKDNRRAGVPVPCMYLPFEDSWPTPLTKETYNYQGYWPTKGDDVKHLVEDSLKAPYIGDALSKGYKDAFLAVQKQFMGHFKQKGYTQTEMQCFYGGKKTHRTNYGSNMWWTTDEPYHWEDWLALQFFCRLWTEGRGQADPLRWAARGDISRPQWQDRVLEGVVDTVYFGTGAFNTPAMNRRCRILARETGLKLMTYGSASPDNESNTRSVVWLVNAWMREANGALPWQTLGGARALDVNDTGVGGNALLVPGKRFGLPVVGDMRLKAMRDGQQLIEYMVLLAERKDLRREQIEAMVQKAVQFTAGVRPGAGADNADALRFSTLKAWQISQLRLRLAELITK